MTCSRNKTVITYIVITYTGEKKKGGVGLRPLLQNPVILGYATGTAIKGFYII